MNYSTGDIEIYEEQDMYEDTFDEEQTNPSYVIHDYVGRPINVPQVSTKVPPAYDGRTSWFAYEEAVDEWCDVTELEARKQGPALRNRLEGEAVVYKPLLDRDLLCHEHGVAYFKRTMRPNFVKGTQSVFLWRLFQLWRLNRGSADLLRWIGRMAVTKKRLEEAWMDVFVPMEGTDPVFLQMVDEALRTGRRRDPQEEGQEFLDTLNGLGREQHRGAFPFTDNLFTLIFIVLADLNETQRERLTSHLSLRGIALPGYTFSVVSEAMIELFCAPRSSLEWPGYRTGSTAVRSFCVIEEGTMDEQSGFWV